VSGIPQVAPVFGLGTGNLLFSGPGANEDFGLEEFTGDPGDRDRCRTAPRRNLRLQPAFFHNGSFTRLEDAVAYHLNVVPSARQYDPIAAGLDSGRTLHHGP